MEPNPSHEKFRKIFRIALPVAGLLIVLLIIYAVSKDHSSTANDNGKYLSTVAKDTSILSIDSTEIYAQNDTLVKSIELTWGVDRVNIKDALENIAGVTGSVKWTYNNSPEKYKDNPDVFIANGYAQGSDDKKKSFEISLLVNRKNQKFKVLKAFEDGRQIKGPLIIMSLAIQGGYSHGITL